MKINNSTPTSIMLFSAMLIKSAYCFEVDGIYYSDPDYNNCVTVIGGASSLTQLTIPSSVKYEYIDYVYDEETGETTSQTSSKYCNVKSIANDAFKDRDNLISLVVNEGVSTIGWTSFFNCSQLERVTLPTSLSFIGGAAFDGCRKLDGVYIKDVAAWCNVGFGAMNGNPLQYGAGLYLNGTLQKNLTIPPTVETIKRYVFRGCGKIESVTIHDGVQAIEFAAFDSCNDLINVTLPSSVSWIASQAFSHCKKLSGINIPHSVVNIGTGLFYGCSSLETIDIPEGVKNIGIGLGDGRIYPGLSKGMGVFGECVSLGQITIPETVDALDVYTFSGCSSLSAINFLCTPPNVLGKNDETTEAQLGLRSCTATGIYPVRYRVEWKSVLDKTGLWHGLKMEPSTSVDVMPTEMDWGRKELTIGWSWSVKDGYDDTPPASYSIYYSDNTNSYDTANVVVEGLSGLLRSYKDSQYLNRLDGLKPVCYFVVGSDGSVGVCQTRNRHGIFVGLNEWDDPNLKPIGGDKNANDLYYLALLQGGFQDSNISLLLNRNATITNVNAAFEKVKVEALPGDVCLFYFSTHGGIDTGNTACLCMYNGYYTDQMLAKKIADIDDGKGIATIGIVSACHSGGLYDTDPSWDGWYVNNNLAQCSPNVAWLSSSDVANTAYGVFNKFLLEYGWEKGWAGTDEIISFNDLATYTKGQYDALFRGTIYKEENKSKTAQIEDPGGLLASIVAGRRGSHETGIEKPSTPNNVDVKTGLYLDQLDVTLNPVTDADGYCIFLLREDGAYEKIWTPSIELLQVVDSEHSLMILSNRGSISSSLQVMIKAVNGAGISQAAISERKDIAEITFDGNGGEVGNWRGAEPLEIIPGSGCYEVSGDVSVGSKLLTLPSAGTYRVAGYVCKGWFDENGIEATSNTVVAQSTVYYARWEPCLPEPEFNTDENGTLIGIDYNGATEITIPDTVTSITNGAFGYNSELERVTIPASVTYIHAYAFDNCNGLTEITVAEDNPYYKSTNGLLLTKDGKTLVQGVNGDVAIPFGVTTIGDSAFYGCSGLTNVTITESVTAIEEYGFGECTSLASIIIPSNVARIGDYAFSDCEALEIVEFEGNRDNIEMDVQNVFYGTPWLISTLPKPENDNYEAAILLAGDSGRITGTNVGATPEIIESELDLGRATIWWKWASPVSYEVAFDTLGSLFDTVLAVYAETENGLAEIAYNDDCDESNEYESRVAFNAEKGTMYYIVASGYDSDTGTIFLNWEPYSDTPIPGVTNVSELESALVGSTDTNLAVNITSMAFYDAYRAWATGLEASALAVKRSPYTWLSFALGADALINKELTSNDVKIESFTPASTDGKFEFTVSVKDVNIGGGSVAVETLKENLKKVLGVEGAATLSPSGFSSDNIDITFDTPVDGKARFTVSPPADAGSSFFMRVKVK